MMSVQIGMFDKPAAPPKLIPITGMEWKADKDGNLKAQGKRGCFALWKEGKRWKGNYSNNSGTYRFNLPRGLSLLELKEICESNYYWEK